MRTISVEVELQGTPTRNYEASLTWAISSSASTRSSKVQVTLIKHPAVGVLEDPYTVRGILRLILIEDVLHWVNLFHFYMEIYNNKSQDLWCWSCFFQICLNAQIVKPHFNPFFTTEDVLTANYHSTVKAELFEGETCEEAPVLLLEVRKRGEENLPKRAWV